MPDSLALQYDLSALPTAQHRAGLAGLAIAVDTMRSRRLPDVPEITHDSRSARLILTSATLTALFNDLYEATTEESRQYATRKKDGVPIEPLRTETDATPDPRTGKTRIRTVYIYPQVVPKALALAALTMPEPWLKLWRDVVWATLRGVPKTRLPYEQRAERLPVAEAAHQWGDLQRQRRTEAKGALYATEVSSALYIGAQAANAERVPFVGSPAQNLLLHFWPLVMGVGEGRVLSMDHDVVREETTGYILTVPDVLDLDGFIEEYRAGIGQLTADMAGFRPRDAVLSLPEEGGLNYLSNLAAIARAKANAGNVEFNVAAMEVYHLQKRGNNIAMLGSGRVPANRSVVEQYDAIRREYRNLLFRGQLIRNLLRRQPWYTGFDRLFAGRDLGLFLGDAGKWFATESARKFQEEFGVLQRS
jgi:CRISPR-associated protein Cmx8